MNSAYVRKAQKYTHYTIDPIGGEKELKAWRDYQALKEAQWQKEQEAFRAKRKTEAEAIVRMDKKATTIFEHEDAESRYIDYRAGKPRQNLQMTPVHVPTPETSPQASKTLYDRFIDICANVWRNAFDSER